MPTDEDEDELDEDEEGEDDEDEGDEDEAGDDDEETGDDDEEASDDDDGDEDEGDEDDDDDGGRANEYKFDRHTEGVILAGRPIEISGMKRRDLGRLAQAVEEIGKRAGLALQLTPGGDNTTRSGPSDEDDVYCGGIIGLEAARGGSDEPDAVDRAKVLQKLDEACSISDDVWSEIATLLPPSTRRHFDQNPDVSLHIACVGPLSAASLVYGILGERDDATRPGKFHRGQDMRQEPHETGVWGVRAAFCQYEGPDVDSLDLGDEEHDDRVRRVKTEGAAYYLIARYD